MTTTDQPTEGTRWRGYSHKDLYLMLHDGPGAASSAEPSRRWADISSTLSEIGQDLRTAINQTGDAWSGRAAGAAYDRLATTAAWAENSGESAGAMRLSVEDQGDHIAKARADMPKPEDVPAVQPDPTAAPVAQVVQAQTDAEPAEATASSAEERAVEVMAAYEENTNITTAALAQFDTPRELLGTYDIHHNKHGGLLGILPTVAAGLLGGGSRHDDHRGRGNDHRGNWHSPSTSESSARWEEGRRGPTSAPAPGKMMGVSTDPLFTPQARQQERAASRGNSSGSGGAAGNSNNPATGARSGAANVPMAPHELQQAAAASQAAASAGPGAGAPIAPAAGPVGGAQDKMTLRRFGMEAIGSSQWFGDTDEPVVGESPKRRFDLRGSADNTEQATILDDEHHVPPNVIGELGR